MNIDRIKKIKKYHTILSFIVFFSVLIYCTLKIRLSITTNPLSKFGIHEETNLLWMSSLIITSLVLWVNSMTITDWDLKYKKTTWCLFTIASIGLIGVAFVDMEYNKWVHNISAGIFFLFYIISVFFTGLQMIKSDFRIAMISIFISVLMTVNILWLVTSIQSVPEILFVLLSFLWNFIIVCPSEFKKLLKSIGF